MLSPVRGGSVITMYFPREVECAICGKKSDQKILASTNTMGPPDLDLRPAELKRSTMPMWVQRCPHCGYRAPRASEATGGAEQFIKDPDYIELSRNKNYPRWRGTSFVAPSCRKAGSFAKAGWYVLYAAWACDDAENGCPADECRMRA